MSKKNKKLKKKFKQEMLAQVLKEENQTTTKNIGANSSIAKNANIPQNLGQNFSYDANIIKSDLFKIAFVFGILILLVVAIYFINLKYPIINNLANFLTKTLNIN
ncbi:MAG: hypothetical protein M1338_01315 [Patescibacteria group bacterium]|nr:hypothetical protein [Patescibacteria group bacterium]